MIEVIINNGIKCINHGNPNSTLKIFDNTFKRIFLLEHDFDKEIEINHTYFMDLIFTVRDKDTNEEKNYTLPELDVITIECHSAALGDQIAWIPVCDEFRKKYNIKDLTVACKYPELFEPFYPEIKFIRQYFEGEEITDNKLIKTRFKYLLGWSRLGFKNDKGQFISPIDSRVIPLQHQAMYQLGLVSYDSIPKEVKPNFKSNIEEPIIKGDYVVITTTGTSKFKLWMRPKGYEDIIAYFRSKGLKVIDVGVMSDHFEGTEDYTGKLEWNKLMNILQHAKLFFCASNGVQWLAWAVGCPVVTVSNITEEGTEFDHYKVTNKEVCHGCWNDPEFVFDNEDIWYCPRKKDFECTKEITPEMVIKKIEENELI
jgi:autotransporter strand-loop-strand O-heptosyltransferase